MNKRRIVIINVLKVDSHACFSGKKLNVYVNSLDGQDYTLILTKEEVELMYVQLQKEQSK